MAGQTTWSCGFLAVLSPPLCCSLTCGCLPVSPPLHPGMREGTHQHLLCSPRRPPSASLAFFLSLPVQIQCGSSISSTAPSSQGHVSSLQPPLSPRLGAAQPATTAPASSLICMSSCRSSCLSEHTCPSPPCLGSVFAPRAIPLPLQAPSVPTGQAFWPSPAAGTARIRRHRAELTGPGPQEAFLPPPISTPSPSRVSVLFVCLGTGPCVENTQAPLEGSGHITHTRCAFLGVGDHAARGVWAKDSASLRAPLRVS